MAENYLTVYQCPICFEYCDTYREAEDHCPVNFVEEYYKCEICGRITADEQEIKECHG